MSVQGYPGFQAAIEISCKKEVSERAYPVHYTLLLQNQGGYYNSLILKALELPSRECNKKKSPRINLNRSEKNERWQFFSHCKRLMHGYS